MPKSISKKSSIRDGILTLSLADKEVTSVRHKSDVQIMRDKLHVSAARSPYHAVMPNLITYTRF